jgi:hypothetical protein
MTRSRGSISGEIGESGRVLSITESFLLWVHFLAYNMIRLLMAQAAVAAAVHPRNLSFKHTVQLWSEWTMRGLSNPRNTSINLLFSLIGQLRVGNRPGRVEPRARKRRPKPYAWLKIPRDLARQRIAGSVRSGRSTQ